MNQSQDKVTVTVQMTVEPDGGFEVVFLDSHGNPWKPGYIDYGDSVSYTFEQEIVLADPGNTSAGFYAISFGGTVNPRPLEGTKRQEIGDALATDVSQQFLDGWWCGNASFTVGDTRSEFVSQICVNVDNDSSKTPNPGQITFQVNNENDGSTTGAVSVRVTFQYTDSNGYDYFLISRDPEITLRKKPS